MQEVEPGSESGEAAEHDASTKSVGYEKGQTDLLLKVAALKGLLVKTREMADQIESELQQLGY